MSTPQSLWGSVSCSSMKWTLRRSAGVRGTACLAPVRSGPLPLDSKAWNVPLMRAKPLVSGARPGRPGTAGPCAGLLVSGPGSFLHCELSQASFAELSPELLDLSGAGTLMPQSQQLQGVTGTPCPPGAWGQAGSPSPQGGVT